MKVAEYVNGNYKVSVYEDGTKIRESPHNFLAPEYPESIDMKITNKCDLGCAWCHEKSEPNGEHANMGILLSRLSGLPEGIEIALGGGDPLSYPYLHTLLCELRAKGFITNITVNARHIYKYWQDLTRFKGEKLIYGIGISYDSINFFDTPDTVYHVIAGINTFDDIQRLVGADRKVLILGYKSFGRGEKFYNESIKANIMNIRINLWKILGKGIISFDNLAIEQLAVKDHFTEAGWKEFYMGDDGHFTMYYDAVKDEYAISSISKRHPARNNVNTFFKELRR